MTANKPKQNSWLKRQLRSTRRAVKALERWLKSIVLSRRTKDDNANVR